MKINVFHNKNNMLFKYEEIGNVGRNEKRVKWFCYAQFGNEIY